MPIYEYVCESCGRLTEVMQKVSDPSPASCPECGEGRMAKMVSRTSFHLKGGGWYADLYSSKTEKPNPADKADKPGAGGAATGSEKPATGTPPAAPAATAPAAAASPPAGGGTSSGTSGGAAGGGSAGGPGKGS